MTRFVDSVRGLGALSGVIAFIIVWHTGRPESMSPERWTIAMIAVGGGALCLAGAAWAEGWAEGVKAGARSARSDLRSTER